MWNALVLNSIVMVGLLEDEDESYSSLISLSLQYHLLMLVFFFPGSSYARSSVVTAVKFTISDHPQTIDPLLKNCIGKLFVFRLQILSPPFFKNVIKKK